MFSVMSGYFNSSCDKDAITIII